MNLQLALVLGYSLVLICLGVFVGRFVKSTGAFFVAGRSLGPGLVFATLLAANIGAGSTVAATGIGYTQGLVAWWWVGSAGIGTLVLAFWVGPRMWRVAKEHDLKTVGDFLELRYGSTVRGIVSSLLWLGTLFVLAAQLLAVARELEAIAGIPKVVGCLIGGAVMTTYFAAGGLLSSAWVNLVQLVVLLGGFVIVVPIAVQSVGGLGELSRVATEIDPALVDPFGGGVTMLRYIALLVPAFIVSPGILQKLYGARDERSVRVAVFAVGIVLLVFAFVPPILGLVSRIHFSELASPGLALPRLLVEKMPLALGTLGLAAIFSAEVSSADAILFMLSTSLSRDLFQRFLKPEASDAEVLRVARGAAFAGGLLGVVLAIAAETIVQTLTIFYSLLSVSLFVPVVAGLFARRVRAREGLAAIGAGVATLLVVTVWTSGAGFGIWNPTLLGVAVSALVFAAVRLLGDRKESDVRAS